MTDPRTIWSLLAAGAFLAAYAGVRLVERHARTLGLVDLPNTRSSHVVPRPRGGGLGIIAGVIVSALVAPLAGRALPHELWIVIAAALAVAVVGLWDDVRGLGVWPRLAVQTIAAAIVVAFVGGVDRLPLPPPADVPLGPLGSFVTVIWIVGVTNFFNFMDGLDGLAAGQALITLAAFACVVWPADAAGLAIVAAAASFAFLLRNWSPARIFLGDVGSAFLGFLLAALPLAAGESSRSPLVLLVWISLALFLLDPVATLRPARPAGSEARSFAPPACVSAIRPSWSLARSESSRVCWLSRSDSRSSRLSATGTMPWRGRQSPWRESLLRSNGNWRLGVGSDQRDFTSILPTSTSGADPGLDSAPRTTNSTSWKRRFAFGNWMKMGCQ